MAQEFEKDEYEMQLYDFTLRDFKEENFQFVNEQIGKAMHFMDERFCDMVKNVRQEVKDKITDATKIIRRNIEESCTEGIDKILNTQIEELLAIPENTLLPGDMIQFNGAKSESRHELEKECSELIKVMNENALFISCLEKEYNSYAIKNILQYEEALIEKAEEYINMPCEVGIYLESMKKAQDFNE